MSITYDQISTENCVVNINSPKYFRIGGNVSFDTIFIRPLHSIKFSPYLNISEVIDQIHLLKWILLYWLSGYLKLWRNNFVV